VINIPDAPGPEVYDSVLVFGLPTSIDSTFGLAGVCFNINHTYDQDLVIAANFSKWRHSRHCKQNWAVLMITSQEPVLQKMEPMDF